MRWCWLIGLLCLAAPQATAQVRPGLELGPELYYYSYREPNFVRQSGPFAGLNGSYTAGFGAWFATGNLIGDVGYLDYHSSGTGRLKGIWNFSGDLRGLFGRDLPLSSGVAASPYLGVGYRVLFDKAGGRSTTTGASGYDRLSQYLYLPLGVGLGIASGDWLFRPSVEYDVFLHGMQNSYLSEVGFDADVTNQQRRGYGLRASVLAETGRLSFGPFLRYWNIENSESAAVSLGGAPAGRVFEPANKTIEAGVTLRLHL